MSPIDMRGSEKTLQQMVIYSDEEEDPVDIVPFQTSKAPISPPISTSTQGSEGVDYAKLRSDIKNGPGLSSLQVFEDGGNGGTRSPSNPMPSPSRLPPAPSPSPQLAAPSSLQVFEDGGNGGTSPPSNPMPSPSPLPALSPSPQSAALSSAQAAESSQPAQVAPMPEHYFGPIDPALGEEIATQNAASYLQPSHVVQERARPGPDLGANSPSSVGKATSSSQAMLGEMFQFDSGICFVFSPRTR
jgi:hypothetical protein